MAIPDEIPNDSTEFLTVVLDSDDDLTTAGVELGLSSSAVDPPASWLAGAWEAAPSVNTARTSVPVDFSTLTPGHYRVWARVSDSPEIIPRPYGTVRVV